MRDSEVEVNGDILPSMKDFSVARPFFRFIRAVSPAKQSGET